jgi:hypothetical protein
VLILKEVKVACFVILLQVLILNGLAERVGPRELDWQREPKGKPGLKIGKRRRTPIPVFSYEWQAKDLQEQECV